MKITLQDLKNELDKVSKQKKWTSLDDIYVEIDKNGNIRFFENFQKIIEYIFQKDIEKLVESNKSFKECLQFASDTDAYDYFYQYQSRIGILIDEFNLILDRFKNDNDVVWTNES